MGEIIRFVPRPERERARLIQEARAIYDRIFPPADPVGGARNKASASHTVSGGNARCIDVVDARSKNGMTGEHRVESSLPR